MGFYKLFLRKILSSLLVAVFSLSTITPVHGQFLPASTNLPAVGTILQVTQDFAPALLKGITINPDNPLEFDFIIDSGDVELDSDTVRIEADKLIRYFLTSLTIPEDQVWVNLSPEEEDRIIADDLSLTQMGRDMLAQDYILKQLTASLVMGDEVMGDESGVMNSRVWIVPEEAVVYEKGASAFVVGSKLKVLSDRAYLDNRDIKDNRDNRGNMNAGGNGDMKAGASPATTGMGNINEDILLEIENEVNTGEHFAPLRQIYNAIILASWYKDNLKESLLGQVYVNKNKIKGIDDIDANEKMKIYNQYLDSFRKGAVDMIKEEYDPATQAITARKYFAGGVAEMHRVPQIRRDITGGANLVRGSWSENALIGEILRSGNKSFSVKVGLGEAATGFKWNADLGWAELVDQLVGAMKKSLHFTWVHLQDIQNERALFKNEASLIEKKDMISLGVPLGDEYARYVFRGAVDQYLKELIPVDSAMASPEDQDDRIEQLLEAMLAQYVPSLENVILMYSSIAISTKTPSAGAVILMENLGLNSNIEADVLLFRGVLGKYVLEHDLAMLPRMEKIAVYVNDLEILGMFNESDLEWLDIEMAKANRLIDHGGGEGAAQGVKLEILIKVKAILGDYAWKNLISNKKIKSWENEVSDIVRDHYSFGRLRYIFGRKQFIITRLKKSGSRKFSKDYAGDQTIPPTAIGFYLDLVSRIQKLNHVASVASDSAMNESSPKVIMRNSIAIDREVGGIDFDRGMIDLQIKRDGNGVLLPTFQQPVGSIEVEGFVPFIIKVTPLESVAGYMGAL